jgi:hypothetical protein
MGMPCSQLNVVCLFYFYFRLSILKSCYPPLVVLVLKLTLTIGISPNPLPFVQVLNPCPPPLHARSTPTTSPTVQSIPTLLCDNHFLVFYMHTLNYIVILVTSGKLVDSSGFLHQ